MKIETIHLCIDIADNYGDMGWVLEFLLMAKIIENYSIVTDDRKSLSEFLWKSGRVLPAYEIIEKSSYAPEPDTLIILGLHAEYDMSIFPPGCHVIRVNYLTYSPWYRSIHNREHIFSTPSRPIIELTYSPLSETGWVWHYPSATRNRSEWLERKGLDISLAEKIWIPIFAYRETLDMLDLSMLPDDVHLFFIGESPLFNHSSDNIHHFSWLPREDFWSLIDLADISILRWEISSLRGLMSGQPFLWDMYKWVWGWNRDDSESYLDFIDASHELCEIHDRINRWGVWVIGDILSVKNTWKRVDFQKIPDFHETLEKTIDSFGFSL